MKEAFYRRLLRHVAIRFFFLYFAPLFLLTLFFLLQDRMVLSETRARHLMVLAEQQAAYLDLFLEERLLNLRGAGDGLKAGLAAGAAPLAAPLKRLQQRNEAFVDLAVLDRQGRVLAYDGPYGRLAQSNYAGEPWFVALADSGAGEVITDIYPGFRGSPHFTMAVPVTVGGEPRFLKATLSPERIRDYIGAFEGSGEVALPEAGLLAGIAARIWLLSGVFVLLGAAVSWLLARRVAREQWKVHCGERELTEQLIQSSKLATVGELAAGIAHEINNPLAVIQQKAGLVKDLLDPGIGTGISSERIGQHLAAIEIAVARCAVITRKLLDFVRPAETGNAACDPRLVIDDVVEALIGPELADADIRIIRTYGDDLPPAAIEAQALAQVLLNLVKNAADAIEGSGAVTITADRDAAEVVITVADTGCGLSPEEMRQVFVPFYTTKAPGRGTGLGLSVSYRIIEGAGGGMTVRSAPGEGASFTVRLPAAVPRSDRGGTR